MKLFIPIACVVSIGACTSSSGMNDGGADSGTDSGNTVKMEYKGEGCAYTWRAPESRGFVDFKLDDGAMPSAADGTPARVRLGLFGGTDSSAADYVDPTSQIAVTWDTPAAVSVAQVKFGKSKTALDTTRKGYSLTIPPPSAGLGTGDPPSFVHEVHLCGLDAGTTYYYQVGGGTVWSEIQSFTTAPKTGTITVGVSGDARDDKIVWQTVQRRMKDAGATLQLFTGDLVLTGTLKALYENWLDVIWKDPNKPGDFITLGQQPMLLVPGNHENAAAQFYGMFSLPGDGAYAESFGSFDVGSVHFIFLDDQRIATDRMGMQATAQLEWLKQDLGRAQAKRAERPFIVALYHRSPYSTSKHRNDSDVATAREALVPLWDQFTVDAVLGGHDHDFERSKPLRGGMIAGTDPQPTVQMTPTDGTNYFVSGGAGAEPYGPSAGANYYSAKQVQYGGSTSYQGFYSILTIEPKKLTITSRGMKASSSNVMGDDMVDELVIQK